MQISRTDSSSIESMLLSIYLFFLLLLDNNHFVRLGNEVSSFSFFERSNVSLKQCFILIQLRLELIKGNSTGKDITCVVASKVIAHSSLHTLCFDRWLEMAFWNRVFEGGMVRKEFFVIKYRKKKVGQLRWIIQCGWALNHHLNIYLLNANET